MDYTVFYQSINKPFFAPPPYVFGIAWGIIYPLIAISFIFLIYLFLKKRVSPALLLLFLLNLIANFAFTPILLGVKNILFAVFDIYVVLLTLVAFEYKIFKPSKTIFWLLIPYLLWGAFATILLTYIAIVN